MWMRRKSEKDPEVGQSEQDTDSTAKTHKEMITFAAEVAVLPGAFRIGTKAHHTATAVGAQGIGADRIGATW